MKICFIFSNFYLADITGQAGLVMKLIQKARKRSFRISVISNDIKARQFTKNGISHYLIKGLGDFKTYFFNFFSLIRYVKNIAPHIIQVNGILMTIYVWVISRFSGVPFSSLISETIDNINPIYKKLYSICSRNCKNIFVTANFLKKQLIEIGVEKNKIKVVRIGLNEKYVTSYKKIKENIDVLYFGDSNHDRGFDFVVKLAEKLRELKFLISIRYEYNNCKNELELAKRLPNVKLLFYPYKQSLASLIAQSKLVILPYRWMLIRPPISLLESMALGKCVMTSSMLGNEEIVMHNKNGIIANFSELDDTVKRITYLLKNIDKRNRFGESAHQTIKEMYSEKEYSKIIDHYAPEKPSP